MYFNKQPIKAVLFDLDGTLLDTATDLGHALNNVLTKRSLTPLSQTLIRPAAGRGCRGLLKAGMDIDEAHPEYKQLCTELLGHYHSHLADTTQFFPGMEAVLQYLEESKTPWGIVTNKPERFTLKLIEKLQLTARAACIVSGDTLKNSKPHPEPILHACQLLQQNPAECLYVGDSEIDVIASRAAGSPVLTALYGYISAEEDPYQWNADGYIKHPDEIITLLG
jgi:2-phosphoglycolate phosphatase